MAISARYLLSVIPEALATGLPYLDRRSPYPPLSLRRRSIALQVVVLEKLLLTKPPTRTSGAFRYYGIADQRSEPTSGLEPVT